MEAENGGCERLRMEAEKCLAQSEQLSKENEEFENEIYAKVTGQIDLMADLNSCRQLNFDDLDIDDGDCDNIETGVETLDDLNEVDMDEEDGYDQTTVESVGGGDNSKGDSSLLLDELVPKLGMEFETEKDAYEFYKAYSKKKGFGIRWGKSHYNKKTRKLTDRIFCCSAQGKKEKDKRNETVKVPRAETRFDCKAEMRIKLQGDGNFCVDRFIEDHTHCLSSPDKTHFYRCHRKISSVAATQIEMATGVGIRPKASYDLMAKEVGGREHLGFIPDDYKNYLRSKRTRAAKVGDTGGVLEYLHKMQFEDPNFFYAIQVDEDDLMTSIFWAHAKMRADYAKFGDVVCFDTTYRKNNEGRPIAIFVGVNHHKQTVVFGVALLYDETCLTFEWLFDTFAKAMGDKKPTTILTDQDPAMGKALSLRWRETNHRLCIWHIFQNAAVHLSSVFSEFKDFSKDFSSCIYDFEEEEDFFNAWNEMLKKYGLEDNTWLRRMFGIKERWALVYGRQMFCADLTTTQRSESMNSIVKRYVTYQHKFLDFFKHFERLLEDRRYEELKADFKMKTSIPSLPFPLDILRHAARVYTPEVFECFQKEWHKSHSCTITTVEQIGSFTKYEVTPYKKSFHHKVTYDLSSGQTECSCRKFEFAGILCSHVLKAFSLTNVMEIPSQYVLKRWTREAKLGYVGGETTPDTPEDLDPKVCQHIRYKKLCGLYIQLVTKAAEREDTYNIAKEGVLKMLADIDIEIQGNKSKGQHASGKTPVEEIAVQHSCANEAGTGGGADNTQRVKGIKRKEKSVSGKRCKSGLEKTGKKGRKSSKKDQKSSTKATITSPTLSLLDEGRVEQFRNSSAQFQNLAQEVSRVECTNYMGQVTTPANSLHMIHSQQPYYFPPNNYQVVSGNFIERSFVESTPNLMSMRDSNLASLGGGGIGEIMVDSSQQSTTVNSQISTRSVIEMCRCPFPCPGGMLCSSRK